MVMHIKCVTEKRHFKSANKLKLNFLHVNKKLVLPCLVY